MGRKKNLKDISKPKTISANDSSHHNCLNIVKYSLEQKQ